VALRQLASTVTDFVCDATSLPLGVETETVIVYVTPGVAADVLAKVIVPRPK
jgi:hypothetical protein